MGFTLPKAKTMPSGADLVRIAIPADVRPMYKARHGVGWEERLRIAPGTPPAQRKQQHGEFTARINRQIETIRMEMRGDGINLSHKDAWALAGEWYVWFVQRHESNPGHPEHWDTGSGY